MNPKPMQTLLDQTFSLDSKTSCIYAEWPKLGVPRAYAEFEVKSNCCPDVGGRRGDDGVSRLETGSSDAQEGIHGSKELESSRRGMSGLFSALQQGG